jgi:hypothetical protein
LIHRQILSTHTLVGTGAKAAAAPTRERQIAAVFIVKMVKSTQTGVLWLPQLKQATRTQTDNLVEEKSQKI